MLRQPRFDAAGILHHIMVRVTEKQSTLRTARDRKDLRVGASWYQD